MPWKQCNMMDERLKFVARHLEGGKMAVLCRDSSTIFASNPVKLVTDRIKGMIAGLVA